MIEFLASYGSLADLILFNSLLAFSQYIVLRAGLFSLGTAAFAALGAYAAALCVTKAGLPASAGLAAALAIGTVAGAMVALPLSRLRGVFQALATLALVQIVLSAAINATSITNGSIGINSIPKSVGTSVLLGTVLVVVLLLRALGANSVGRAFDVIREDETVAVTLGISVHKHHMIAFILSGAIAGLPGGLHALNSYSITPGVFGFQMLVNVLAMVVLGGSMTVWGALCGAIILSLLPELFRVFSDYRMVMHGLLLGLVIIFLPRGVADTLIVKWRDHKLSKRRTATTGGAVA